ncbi:MAG: GNAT family N-acetyltransferase [Cyanobacteria bacterium J06648_10]
MQRSSTPMEFETPRLYLRDWRPAEDARHAMDIFGDARVAKWMKPGQYHQGTEHVAKDTSIRQVQGRLVRYIDQAGKSKKGDRSWAVVQKDIGRVIGSVEIAMLPDMEDVRAEHVPEPIEGGLSTEYMEIGWYFRPSSWGFGYASEAASRIMQHSFETLNLPVLLAMSQPENVRSLAVMNRLGMRADGITTRCYGGKPLLLYTLTAEKWAEAARLQTSAEL